MPATQTENVKITPVLVKFPSLDIARKVFVAKNETIESGDTFTLNDLCEKLLRSVGARKTPWQCVQAIVEIKLKPEETVFEFYMRLKADKIDYCKTEGLDNSKRLDAIALVNSIVLQVFKTGLWSDLTKAVRLKQDDYENLDERLEIAQTIESVKASLISSNQKDQFEYLTAGVTEINISRNRTPQRQAGRAFRGLLREVFGNVRKVLGGKDNVKDICNRILVLHQNVIEENSELLRKENRHLQTIVKLQERIGDLNKKPISMLWAAQPTVTSSRSFASAVRGQNVYSVILEP
ncbi:hypothetical protein QYM36_002285 [Artemia franciscana]|uniref:Uncharacterized protein n=1 Tax=Artemia franciscana TaxID=6661 RepID=A0AA88I8L7_ARTSF|nr:hypothetical protein QYM36_002285 [Artemia franciscana]